MKDPEVHVHKVLNTYCNNLLFADNMIHIHILGCVGYSEVLAPVITIILYINKWSQSHVFF